MKPHSTLMTPQNTSIERFMMKLFKRPLFCGLQIESDDLCHPYSSSTWPTTQTKLERLSDSALASKISKNQYIGFGELFCSAMGRRKRRSKARGQFETARNMYYMKVGRGVQMIEICPPEIQRTDSIENIGAFSMFPEHCRPMITPFLSHCIRSSRKKQLGLRRILFYRQRRRKG